MEGEATALRAGAARLAAGIDRLRLRAPVAGRIGDAAALHPGAWVAEGQRLVSVVPPGALAIIAEFDAGAALGRIRPGQAARLRLDGFPWAQFGTIPAEVTRVASELREGRIRVEMAPSGPAPAALLQHGLPGQAEVAVEQAAPALLALRAAGLLLSPGLPFQAGAALARAP
ncbi:HlyD family secretion protein [Paracraurococcus ruber]|nr:HlyD family secretion protein [Paracraurococcus ruber]